MKKTLAILTLLIICINIYSQVQPEDIYTKLELLNTTTVRVTNKQDTATAFKVKIPDSYIYNITTDKVQPDSSIIITFPHCGELRVQTTSSCSTTGMNTCIFVLAVVKPLYFYPKQDHNNLSLEFKLPDQPNPNDHYQVRYTFENGTSVTKDLPMNAPKANVYSFNFKMW